MKNLLVVLSFLLLFNLNAQVSQNVQSQNEDFEVKTVLAKKGETLSDYINPDIFNKNQHDINPGMLPEGDFMNRSAFTKDGSKVLVVNGGTGNLTVFDFETMEPIAIVDVGGVFPNCIAVTEDYAIVGALGGIVSVIDLSDYTLAEEFGWSGEAQAVAVQVSPDGNFAYVATDVEDSMMAIDLINMEISDPYFGFPVQLISFSWVSTGGRSSFKHSSFEVSSDGNHLIVGDADDAVLFVDVETGTPDFTVSGIPNCYVVGLSGDGSKTVALSYDNNILNVFQIDNTTHEITGTVEITDNYLATYEVGVNQDGSKAFIGIGNNSSAIVRFETSDFVTFTQTYTPFWIGTSADHQYAVNGQYRFSVLDFETESVVGQNWGYTQDFGCVSPTGFRVVGYDPLRYEGLNFYDCEDPTNVEMTGRSLTGWPLEGDTPYRISISPDGTRAVTSNSLSENMSIINLENYSVEAILGLEEKCDATAISNNSQLAIMGGYDLNTIKLIDLSTNELITSVYTAQRPLMIDISPNDDFAVIGNLKSNSVSIVELDGVNSNEIVEIPTGTIGLTWGAFGVRSSVELDPTGQFVLVAASFDDMVQVIDVEQQQIVAELPVGNFPLKIAFNETGDFAAVTNYNSNSFSIIHVDGAASSVIGTFSSNGEYPLRLAFNPVADEFGIINYNSKSVINVDPPTGNINSTDYYNQYGNPIQIYYDNIGNPIVLTLSSDDIPGFLVRNNEAIELPATPTYFDFCLETNTAVVCMPGPDYVTVIEYDPPSDPPVADFTANVTTIHVGESVEFTDLSLNNPSEWEWEFESGTPASSNEQHPIIAYDSEGTFDVSLSVTNDFGSDMKLETDYISVLPISWVNTNGAANYISVFPNPANDVLNISFDYVPQSEIILAIFNLEGRLIHSESLENSTQQIDLSGIDEGLYLLKIKEEKGHQLNYKFLKR